MLNHIEKYKKIRLSGIELNKKLVTAVNPITARAAARALGLLKRDKLIFSDDAEVDRFTDFVLHHQLNQDGKSIIELFLEQNSDTLTEDEKATIHSTLTSQSSLFEMVSINKLTSSIKLVDVFNNENEIIIIDLGMSQNEKLIGQLIYTRIILIDGIYMTGGASMLFERKHKDDLIKNSQLYAKKYSMTSAAAKQNAAFFKLYNKIGIQQLRYENIDGS